jgi:signal peptidase
VAVAKLKQLWRNEYFQTVITIALIIIIVFGFWFGSQAILNTSYPALDVASVSMLPTLNVGDLIIVQGVPASQIHANYATGDIIVFKSIGDPNRRIVHRAVEITVQNGQYFITTRGDNNQSNDPSPVPEENLIGRVVGKVPFLGNFALFTNALGTFYFIIIAAVIILIIVLALPSGRKEDQSATEPKKRRMIANIEARWIYLLIVDVILVSLIFFTLWGSLTFWQIGADPPQNVTVRGMFPDTAWYETFVRSYNNVSAAYLSQGFFTYKVDALVGELIRPGVPTFSWAQFLLAILILVNAWVLIQWVREKRTPEPLSGSAIKT